MGTQRKGWCGLLSSSRDDLIELSTDSLLCLELNSWHNL